MSNGERESYNMISQPDEYKAWKDGYDEGNTDGYNQALEDMSKKIKEYSGNHYLDCDGYFGGQTELVFRTEEYLDDVLSELKK